MKIFLKSNSPLWHQVPYGARILLLNKVYSFQTETLQSPLTIKVSWMGCAVQHCINDFGCHPGYIQDKEIQCSSWKYKVILKQLNGFYGPWIRLCSDSVKKNKVLLIQNLKRMIRSCGNQTCNAPYVLISDKTEFSYPPCKERIIL